MRQALDTNRQQQIAEEEKKLHRDGDKPRVAPTYQIPSQSGESVEGWSQSSLQY